MDEQAILAQLDHYAERYEFPVLDNGYIYLAAARLHCYRSSSDWALIIEQFGFSHRIDGHERIDSGAYAFGNCISQPGLNSIYATNKFGDYVPKIGPSPTSDGPIGLFATEIDGEEYDTEWINPNAESVIVRGKAIQLIHDRSAYEQRGITLSDPKRIYAYELLRALMPEHKDQFLFEEKQLRNILPQDISKILQLEQWHHVGQDEWGKPSESETFQMLAKLLSTGDTSCYNPSLPPNTHWSHWAEGGRC